MTQTRTIMCFGDSNTYGAIPTLARAGRHRFAPDRRWPGIMRKQLGNGWDVIEEGHGGRTTVHDDPIEGLHKNGLKALPVCLETHMPLDLVIVMLGTNDLKHRFSVTPSDVADSVELLVRTIQRSEAGHAGAPPAVLLRRSGADAGSRLVRSDVPWRRGKVEAVCPAVCAMPPSAPVRRTSTSATSSSRARSTASTSTAMPTGCSARKWQKPFRRCLANHEP